MTRFQRLVITACLGLLGIAGCRQYVHMTKEESEHYRKQSRIMLSAPPEPDEAKITSLANVLQVPTVLNPNEKSRPISLQEVIAIALETGRTRDFFDRQGAGRRSNLIGLQRRISPSNNTDSIRVFSFDPAILATDIENSLSKFDVRLQTSMTWSKTDRPVGTALDTFQAGQRLNIDQDQAQFEQLFIKPLPTGGVASIGFSTDYQLSNLQQRVNPSYRPILEFSFEQPLLQGFGVGINQLTTNHPGSLRNPFPTGGRTDGIILTRIFLDESKVEFERRIHALVMDVEEAYWNLYCAYWTLYSQETSLRGAFAAYQNVRILFEAGSKSGQDLAEAAAEYQRVRALWIQAMGSGLGRPGVLEAERELRHVTGLPSNDGCRLVPSDTPTVAPFQPDYCRALSTAVARRPELILTRQEIQVAHLTILREKNFLLPDLRLLTRYNVNAIGEHLDGRDPSSAFRNLAENNFSDWDITLRATIQLGQREAHSTIRRAELDLAQRILYLRDQEQKLASSLQSAQQTIVEKYELIKANHQRRQHAEELVALRAKEFDAGRKDLIFLLDSLTRRADAIREEALAICDYNVALANYEYQQGTILEHDSVYITDGPLPACAQARASEHIRERMHALPNWQPKMLSDTGDPHGIPTIGPESGKDPVSPIEPKGFFHPTLPKRISGEGPEMPLGKPFIGPNIGVDPKPFVPSDGAPVSFIMEQLKKLPPLPERLSLDNKTPVGKPTFGEIVPATGASTPATIQPASGTSAVPPLPQGSGEIEK